MKAISDYCKVNKIIYQGCRVDKKHKYKMFASRMREDLYRSLKLLSAAEDKPIQILLEEAVTEYLLNRKFEKEFSDDGTVTMFRLERSDPDNKDWSSGTAPIIKTRQRDPESKKDKSGE